MFIKPSKNGRLQRGNVMVIAMLILGAGTFGLAAWTSLVVARSGVVDAMESALVRRVRLENSRQVAKEWVYRKMVGEAVGSGTSQAVGDGWGYITAPSFSVSYLGTQTSAPYNRMSPMPRGAFGASLDIEISDGIANNTGRFFVNSVHPALAGDLLVVSNPPAGQAANPVTGDLRVKGRTVLMTSDNLGHSFKTERVTYPMATGSTPTVSDLLGNTLLPDNFPLTPMTTGLESGVPGWGGQLNVVNNPGNTENSLYHKIASTDHTIIDGLVVQGDPDSAIYVPGDGSVQITLGSSLLGNIVVSQNVTVLNLKGQATATESADAAILAPVSIAVLDSGVTTINCQEENYRPTVLGIKGDTYFRNVALSFTSTVGFPKWKMVMEVENVRILASVGAASSQMTMVGGIRCNAGFEVTAGSPPLYLDGDEDPGTLAGVLPRHGWAESYIQPGT